MVTAGLSAGIVLAFLALLDQGYSLGLPSPGYPCYRQILKALNVRPTLIETSGQGRWMPTVADVERLAGREPQAFCSQARITRPVPWHSAAALPRSPRPAGGIASGLSPTRSITGSNTRLRPRRRWRPFRRGDRRQQLLEIFQHDRLAHWLACRPRAARSAHRAAHSEPLHLAACHLAGGGAGCLRWDRRARGEQGELRTKPRHVARRALSAGRSTGLVF